MPNQTIPVQLPEAIYQRLQQVAHATHHSIYNMEMVWWPHQP
jgi:hypothetical protein